MIELQKTEGTIIQLNPPIKYWWVNQGITFEHESIGGFIQCDPTSKFEHHKLEKTSRNDIILHYADEEIKAISIVTKESKQVLCAAKIPHKRVECEYYTLINPISISLVIKTLYHGLGKKLPIPPFNKSHTIQQGYLYQIDKIIFKILFPTTIDIE